MSVVFIFQALVLLLRAAAWMNMRRGLNVLPDMVPEDVSDQGYEPPAQLTPWITALVGLGFRRIGVSRNRLLSGQEMIAFLYAHPDEPVHVELVRTGFRAFAIFVTRFGDRACLETAYPAGYHVEQPDFVALVESGSIRAAYEKHLSRLREMQMKDGEPSRVGSMPEFLDYAVTYNRIFGGRKTRSVLPLAAGRALSSAYSTLAIGAGIIYNGLFRPSTLTLFAILVIAVVPAMLADVVFFVYSRVKKIQMP